MHVLSSHSQRAHVVNGYPVQFGFSIFSVFVVVIAVAVAEVVGCCCFVAAQAKRMLNGFMSDGRKAHCMAANICSRKFTGLMSFPSVILRCCSCCCCCVLSLLSSEKKNMSGNIYACERVLYRLSLFRRDPFISIALFCMWEVIYIIYQCGERAYVPFHMYL